MKGDKRARGLNYRPLCSQSEAHGAALILDMEQKQPTQGLTDDCRHREDTSSSNITTNL